MEGSEAGSDPSRVIITGIERPIFRWDALLLTGIEDFSTARGNARDTFGDNAPATQTATRRHRR
jgi:hypothetical protein